MSRDKPTAEQQKPTDGNASASPKKNPPRLDSAIINYAKLQTKRIKIPASILLALYALESGWGTKFIARFNPFGIKAAKGQPADRNGYQWFPSMAMAFTRCADILAKGEYYKQAFDAFTASIASIKEDATDRKSQYEKSLAKFVSEISKSWAVDPKHADKLFSIIIDNNFVSLYDEVQ